MGCCTRCQGYGPVTPPPKEHDHDHDHGHGHGHSHSHGGGKSVWRNLWDEGPGREAVVYAVALQAAAVAERLWPQLDPWAFLVALAIGIVPVARQAFASARGGNPFSIEMLMTVAALGAAAIGAVAEAATVVLLYLVGECLETVAAYRSQAGIRALVGLVPQTALRETATGTETVAAEALAPGEVIVVGAGERIAADGVVRDGSSAVDESALTGEPMPKSKSPGDTVFAGTVNGDGTLKITVGARAEDTAIARVVRLVQEAQARKAPVERFIGRFARIYTPIIVGVAGAVMVLPPLLAGEPWVTWIYRGLALLLIGCPCALVISTPAALASGLASGAGRGLLIKGGAVLESLANIGAVAFDKTGTLTVGHPAITDVVALGVDRAEVLGLAAGLSLGSGHPMARAIREAAAAEGVAPDAVDEVTAVPGRGVGGMVGAVEVFLGALGEADATADALMATGKTVSALNRGGVVIGLIAARDALRPDAADGVRRLQDLGIGATMLTGDVAAAARPLADHLAIGFQASLKPEDKLRAVQAMQASGARVAKVGDGINDAPALAAADVGIAFGGGTDVALETADAASLHARVGDVAAMIVLARRTMANIRQNIAIALGLKGVFLVTTIAGITGLWPAVLADTGATVLVTANALRLLRATR
jgi:Zn2+/Cd2+-exporting ATPase